MLFLRIIGIQISNILVSFNKLKEWIFERYEKISLSNAKKARVYCSRRAFSIFDLEKITTVKI